MFDCDELNSSELDVSVPTSLVHDRYKSGEGYHAVPSPYTGTFMPSKPNLVFNDAPTASETVPNVLNVKPRHLLSQLSILHMLRTLGKIYQSLEGNPQQALKDKGVIDSGCSRHMTGNISYLSEFEEINGGYVALVEIQKVVRSQAKMYDEKNNVLFTDTECVALSSDFKLPDENHVLLKVPRDNNMYNVDLKNIVPSRDLTCLFAKATLDESNIWHKRLGHINFKTMNKLVKGNLVRGLPSNFFKYNHTYVACKKGKQHRASCKTKPVSSVSQTLQRVLVTKPHNKTPYELLLGRTHSIGFMRPFGYLVTILNTLDPLGKFDGKADEGFLVGYSISSKAFRVFNSRTRIVQETLHIIFLENQPNVVGSGPTWLFDIDTLTQSMNYQPVAAENQPNSSTGIQETFDASKVGKESFSTQQYVLLPLWSTSSKDPQNSDADVVFDDKENESAVHVSPSSSDKTEKHDEKANREAKERGLTNGVNAASTPVTAVRTNSTNSTNSFNATGPSNNDVSSTFEIGRKYLFVDPSQYHNDPNMPELEDIIYSDDEDDVNAEADFSNLETSITISPILTSRVHKHHPITQIIDDLSLAPQTRSMTRMVKDQGGHTQEEGIDYEEVFAPVARIKAIRLFLAYASFMGFMVYQMDVESTFLYETIKKEVYVCQPLRFEDPDYPDKVYKVVKALYGLHQVNACMSAKRTAWNEFRSSMALAVIWLATVDNLSFHNTKYTSPAFTQKVFANMRRIDKGFSRVDTPLFDGHRGYKAQVKGQEVGEEETIQIIKIKEIKEGGIAELDADEDVTLEDIDAEVAMDADVQGRLPESQAKVYHLDLEHAKKVLSMQDTDESEPTKVEEAIEVVTASKLMTKEKEGVVIQDPEETSTASVIMHSEVKSKDKGKGILIEEPKPLKRQAQTEQDEAFTRQLKAKLNANINWDDVIEQVKRKEKQDNTVMRYQALKRKPINEAQARKNMMVYLKNMAGFKMDFFKGMTYNDIRPIFEKHYNSIRAFLEKGEEEIEEEGSKRKDDILNQDASKKQRIYEETDELKTHLQIIANNDDVYTEATPLALKVPVADYQIYHEHNKPYYKIIRADGTHQLFLSFITLLKNFDREDLEMLWKLV
uniref:Ribonuclease H-like domain-containing protein n=1 Tax=Tanacetum cinerariifolium TaxID=118510 RepID=A0A6L2KA55_TANCI|nr:ribonuclease H-like domain-containing protein [Tanacetum cinerariifolium]